MTDGSHDGGSHVGRPSSWIAVGVMLAGFILGGVGLVTGPSWPLFWAGAAVAAVGGFLALAVGIFSDVVMYTPVETDAAAQHPLADAVAHGGSGGPAPGEAEDIAPGESEDIARGESDRSDAEHLAGG